jgi:hypothetical protein
MLDVTERKVFAITTFVSACICLAPGEWVSGGVLLAVSAALWVHYLRSAPRAPKPDAKPVDDGGSPGKPGSAPIPPAPPETPADDEGSVPTG